MPIAWPITIFCVTCFENKVLKTKKIFRLCYLCNNEDAAGREKLTFLAQLYFGQNIFAMLVADELVRHKNCFHKIYCPLPPELALV